VGGLLGSLGISPFYVVLSSIHVGVGVAGDVLFFAIMAPLSVLAYAADRWVLRRWWASDRRPPFVSTLVFPLIAVAMEFGGGTPPWGSFGATAYTQYGLTEVMQLASVTGLWGIAFVIAWFGSLVNHVWESGPRFRDSWRGVATCTGLLVVVAGFGMIRLATSPDPQAVVHVVGVTSPLEISGPNDPTFEADMAALHDDYLARTRAAADRGAEIVVWPETGAMGPSDQVEEVLDEARALARERGLYLAVTTAPLTEGADHQTVLHIIDPRGDVALRHVKYGGTDFGAILGMTESVPRQLQALETPFGTLSGIVCWDADFPETVRHIGELDVDLLLVPANDWYELRHVHARMAVFRAIENGTSMVRQASNGVSIVTDAYGRELASANTFAGELEVDVQVPLNATATLYPGLGDIVGWAAIVGAALVLVGTWFRSRAAKKAEEDAAPPPPREEAMTTVGR
jgi:apolipoprotein N-acyltransferase